ncbi:hypothetical protein EZS27_035063 [termite gut metagenome]|uniref:Transposase IS200-like domain-containing protein n=1 Tax=termite gut metagenome TaxID=433724 RepID=A0A5J4Q115_9ZZZZ
MSHYKQQSHVVWKCDYHIVWCPQYRFRILTGVVKDLVEEDIRMLCEWKGCEVEEMNVQADHIHFVSFHSAQSVDFRADGNSQRQARHQTIQELSPYETQALLGQSFLVSRLFCQYSWS